MTPCVTIAGTSGLVRHVIRSFGTAAPGDPSGPGGVYATWCGQQHNNLRATVEFLPIFTHPDVVRVAMDVLQQAGVAVDPAVLQLLLPAEPVEYDGTNAPVDERLQRRRVKLDVQLFDTALAKAKDLRRRIQEGLTAAQAVAATITVAFEVRRLSGRTPAFTDLFWARRWGDFVDALLPDATEDFKREMVGIMDEREEKGELSAAALNLRELGVRSHLPMPVGLPVPRPTLCEACRNAFAAALLEEP